MEFQGDVNCYFEAGRRIVRAGQARACPISLSPDSAHCSVGAESDGARDLSQGIDGQGIYFRVQRLLGDRDAVSHCDAFIL
jgi:hypothetical protein